MGLELKPFCCQKGKIEKILKKTRQNGLGQRPTHPKLDFFVSKNISLGMVSLDFDGFGVNLNDLGVSLDGIGIILEELLISLNPLNRAK